MSNLTRFVLEDNGFEKMTIDIKEKMIKAGINTVNIQAAVARKNVIKKLQDEFTLRNNFTIRQVQYEKMPNGRYGLKSIQSSVGITNKAGYMALHEQGGSHEGKNGKNVSIASNTARSGSKSNPVSAKYRLSALNRKKLRGKYKKNYASKKARAVARAVVANQKGLFIHYGKKLFEVTSFTKSDGKVRFRKRLVYNFSLKKTPVKSTRFFITACQKPAEDGQNIFNKELNKLF